MLVDASVERYDDLWIHRTEPLALIRAWHKQPHNRKPQLDDIINFHSIDIEADFLADGKARINVMPSRTVPCGTSI